MHPLVHKVVVHIIYLCKFLSSKKKTFWSFLITNVVLAALLGLLYVTSPSLIGTPIDWLIKNIGVILFIFLTLVFLTLVVWLVGRQEIMPSEHEMRQHYLKDLIHELEPSSLKGLPTSTTLILHAVSLTEIFIPLQLRANRPLVEFPLSEAERAEVRRSLEQGGELSEAMQDILFWREREWLRRTEEGDRLEISRVWQKLTAEHPAAVIQGYPGTGKSTLLDRLALHMAFRLLKQGDPTMPVQLDPVCVPIVVRLNDYATKLNEAEKQGRALKLIDYIETLGVHSSSAQFLRMKLHEGRCLVMFDGLDEVSDPGTRARVQSAIKLFVRETRAHSDLPAHFNRYLITSRVAGYDQNAFENYPHYIIAELSEEQIKSFLPRWCRATVRRTLFAEHPTDEIEERIAREAAELEQKLQEELALHEGVRQLAQYPLLLTLLAVMQHNKIELPKQRVRLYSTVSRTLLESRNAMRGLPTIPEEDVVQRLGPIALRMQEANIYFIRENEVLEALREAILTKGGSPEEIEKEAREFLLRLSNRSGLFVQRSGDYLGFFHRTFQEYFAARALLAQVEHDPDRAIPELVERARRPDAYWREPFLLAVAYQSMVSRTVASRILEAFLGPPQASSTLDNMVLAAECVIESEPSAFRPELERRIATDLLAHYEQAQRAKRWRDCERIEGVLYAWLVSIHTEAYRPPLLEVLSRTLRDATQHARLCAALTLLTIIAQRLFRCAPIVHQTLAPSLQALAFPAATESSTAPTDVPDLDVADLALAAVSLLGACGPAGDSLSALRHHFEEQPAQLRLLASYSLESGILLTPTVVPLSEANYQQYQAAVDRWLSLNKRGGGEQAIAACIEIHRQLLQCAEETCYPVCSHLLAMLRRAEQEGARSWQQASRVWRAYLSEKLATGTYIDYRLCALLWAVLLQDEEDGEALVNLLITHYESKEPRLVRFSQRVISIAANHLRDLRDLRDLIDLGYFRDLRERRGIEYFRDLRYLRGLLDARYLRDSGDLRYLRQLRGLDYVRDSRYLRNIKSLDVLLLTERVAARALQLLQGNEGAEQRDVLLVLLGRVLQVQEAEVRGDAVEQEVQAIIEAVLNRFSQEGERDHQEIILEIVRSLPARTEEEIGFILHLAGQTGSEHIQNACAIALKRARPTTERGWDALEAGRRLDVEAIRRAIDEVARRRVHTEA
jgi:hypothetical protein